MGLQMELPEETEKPILTIVPKSADKKGLTPLQRKSINLLVNGSSKQETANALKLNIRTLEKWKALPNYREVLDKSYADYAQKTIHTDTLNDIELQVLARQTLTKGLSRDPKLSFEYLKQCGLLQPKSEHENTPFSIQFGALNKETEETEDLLREELPLQPLLEPTYRPISKPS